MSEKKTLDQLYSEKERAETQLAQAQRKACYMKISIKSIGYTSERGRFCHSSISGRSLSVISDTIPSLTSKP